MSKMRKRREESTFCMKETGKEQPESWFVSDEGEGGFGTLSSFTVKATSWSPFIGEISAIYGR